MPMGMMKKKRAFKKRPKKYYGRVKRKAKARKKYGRSGFGGVFGKTAGANSLGSSSSNSDVSDSEVQNAQFYLTPAEIQVVHEMAFHEFQNSEVSEFIYIMDLLRQYGAQLTESVDMVKKYRDGQLFTDDEDELLEFELPAFYKSNIQKFKGKKKYVKKGKKVFLDLGPASELVPGSEKPGENSGLFFLYEEKTKVEMLESDGIDAFRKRHGDSGMKNCFHFIFSGLLNRKILNWALSGTDLA
jgi:hypothetical protein